MAIEHMGDYTKLLPSERKRRKHWQLVINQLNRGGSTKINGKPLDWHTLEALCCCRGLLQHPKTHWTDTLRVVNDLLIHSPEY